MMGTAIQRYRFSFTAQSKDRNSLCHSVNRTGQNLRFRKTMHFQRIAFENYTRNHHLKI